MNNGSCSICLQDIDNNLFQLSCKHNFHFNCWCDWCISSLEQKNNSVECPLCRKKHQPPWHIWFLKAIWYCFVEKKNDIYKILSPRAISKLNKIMYA